MAEKRVRDIERVYSLPKFATKWRRLADALESNTTFRIQVAGKRIYVTVQQ